MDGPRFRTMRQSSGVKGSFVCLKDLSKLCFLQRALSDPCRAPSPHLCQEIGSALLDVSKSLLAKYIKQNHTKYKYETKCIIKCTKYETCNVFLEAKSEDNLSKRVYMRYMSMCMSLKSRSQTLRWWWNDFHPVRWCLAKRNPNPAPSFRQIFPSNEHQWVVGTVWFYRSTLAWNFREIICVAWPVSPCLVQKSSARSARTTHWNTQANMPGTARPAFP